VFFQSSFFPKPTFVFNLEHEMLMQSRYCTVSRSRWSIFVA
jgi:hypothetical protein